MVLAMKTLIMLHRVSFHLIWPFKVWLILYPFQDLVHRLPKHRDGYLGSGRPSMSSKISPEMIIVMPFRPKISSVLGNYLRLRLPLSLFLIILNPFILINSIHKLTYTSIRLPCQRLPQIVLSRQADLECPYCYIVKISIYHIKHLPIPIRVRLQGLSLSHGHIQQRIQGIRNLTTSNKLGLKGPGKLLKGAD